MIKSYFPTKVIFAIRARTLSCKPTAIAIAIAIDIA